MLLGVAFGLILAMLIGLTSVLVFGLGGYLWDEYPWATGVVVTVGGLASVIALRRARIAPARTGLRPSAQVHPGITMHAIPVAGGVGLLFTIGYLAMFWFGLPGLRPVVIGLGALGAGLGGVLVLRGRRRGPGPQDGNLLHVGRE